MPTPKASIVIPCYNAEKYLAATLDSALAQTMGDFEVVCVNNNSTDATPQILANYAARDPRIKVLDQADPGEGPAREAGRAAAQGEWLYFLDADDLMLPDLLQKAIARGQNTGADLVVFKTFTYSDGIGETIPIQWSFQTDWLPSDDVAFDPHQHPQRILNSFQNWVHNKLFRRSFVDAHGLTFQHVHRTADLLFTCTALTEATRIALLPEPLHKYRILNANSAMATSDSFPLDFYDAFVALRERLETDGTWDLYHDSFVNWAILSVISNVETARSLAGFKTIVGKIRQEGGTRLDITSFPAVKCDDEWRYQRMRDILELPMEDLLWTHYADLKIRHDATERHASDRRQYVAELEGQLRGKDAEIADLRSQLAAKQEELAREAAALNAIQNSASFKIGRTITSPGRILRR